MGIFDKKEDRDTQAKPDFSNVKAGGSSTAPTATAESKPVGTSGSGRTYTVVSGDSLSKIAQREYGDANKWRTIFEANKDQINDPDLIHPGQTLRIPGA